MTKIEWVKNSDGTQGATWNPVTGCTPISPGCAHCYAKRMARRLAGRYGYPEAPHHFDVTLHPDRLDGPLKWRKPRHVFVCSMSDLFHEDVPFEFIDKVLCIIACCPSHTFQILTKRPERALTYFEFNEAGIIRHWRDENSIIRVDFPLSNVWIGVTAENQEQADKRIPILLQIPAAVRFVSVEPMLGAIDIFLKLIPIQRMYGPDWVHLDWIICGAETGPGARPMQLDWARSLRDQCRAAGVPFFFKKDSNGNRELDGKLWEEYPK